jgi:hypothetical protein
MKLPIIALKLPSAIRMFSYYCIKFVNRHSEIIYGYNKVAYY